MGVLVSKPVKPHKPPTKIRVRSHSGSSLIKKPQLFKSLTRKKDEAPRKTATIQPIGKGDNQPSASQEVKPTNEQVVRQSAVLADQAIATATTTIEEAAINETASKITEEVLEASVEQAQKEEVAVLKETELTDPVAEVSPEQITDLHEAIQQQPETGAVVEPNETFEEIKVAEEASPSGGQRPEEEASPSDSQRPEEEASHNDGQRPQEALMDHSATEGVNEGDNDANPKVQEDESKATLFEPVKQPEVVILEEK